MGKKSTVLILLLIIQLLFACSFVGAFKAACFRAKVETRYTDDTGGIHLLVAVDKRDTHLVRFLPKKRTQVTVCLPTK